MNSISPKMLGFAAGDVTIVRSAETGEAPTRGATLRRLARVAMRRRWVLLGAVAAGAVVGVVVTLVTPRQYASTVRLQIARETAQVVNVGAISRDVSIGDQEFYQTEYGLLRAQGLAERVARDLNVADDPAFFRGYGKGEMFDANPGGAGHAKRSELAGEILLSHLEVAPIHGSSLVDIQAKAPSPDLSRRIAETWGRDFIAANLERRLQGSTYATTFLEARLDQLRGKLESSERRAMEYAASQGIIDLSSTGGPKTPGADLSQGRSLTSDDLIALNGALEAATADRVKASSELAAFAGHPDATGDALSYRAIGLLRKDRADAASQYARLTAGGAASDPSAKGTQAQIEVLDTAIKGEEARLHASLQQTYQAALGREQALTRKVDVLKGQLADLRRRSIQYNIFQRDADTNRQLYEALLQRYKEVGVAGAAENNNVAVVDAARAPDEPSSPHLSINLVLFTLAGLILGVLIAAVLEQLDDGDREAGEAPLPPATPAG